MGAFFGIRRPLLKVSSSLVRQYLLVCQWGAGRSRGSSRGYGTDLRPLSPRGPVRTMTLAALAANCICAPLRGNEPPQRASSGKNNTH